MKLANTKRHAKYSPIAFIVDCTVFKFRNSDSYTPLSLYNLNTSRKNPNAIFIANVIA